MSSSWQRSVPDMWECLLWIWFGLMVLSLCSINVEYSYHNQMFRSTPICFFYLKKSADVAIVLVHVFWELTLLFKNDLIVISKYCMFLILFNWNILRIVILFNVYFIQSSWFIFTNGANNIGRHYKYMHVFCWKKCCTVVLNIYIKTLF